MEISGFKDVTDSKLSHERKQIYLTRGLFVMYRFEGSSIYVKNGLSIASSDAGDVLSKRKPSPS